MKIPLPAAALEDRLAIVGRSGYGKTNAAKVMAEALLTAGARVCILDPTDAWWGLRLKPDGKRPAFPVAIFGGAKGDLPLTEHAGDTIGAAIASSSQSTIVSIADFVGENARRRFASALLGALYQHNRAPLHLIVDEADTLAPQKPLAPLDAEVLARMQQIVRRGRIRGFVPWLITQRPAVLSKDVLSQADALIAFNLTASQDRDAIGAWIEGQADRADERRILAELPKLERGSAMVWAPGHNILERVAFPLSHTFDSGRTPKRGEARPDATLKPIDVEGLRGRIAEVAEKAKADDPAALRKRVRELEAELAKAGGKAADPAAIDAARTAGLMEGLRRGSAEGYSSARDAYGARIRQHVEALEAARKALLEPMSPPAVVTAPSSTPATMAPPIVRAPGPPAGRPAPAATADGLSGPQQRILDALAWLEMVGVSAPDRTRVAWLADASPNSSGFQNNLGRLSNALGLIRYPRPGFVELTEAGRAVANKPERPPTNAALHDAIRAKLPAPQWAIVAELIACYPQSLTRHALAGRCGVSEASSGYQNNLGALRSLGLLDYPERGQVVALPVLFVE